MQKIKLENWIEIVQDYLELSQDVYIFIKDGFKFDEKKVPYFNIPNLENIKVKILI